LHESVWMKIGDRRISAAKLAKEGSCSAKLAKLESERSQVQDSVNNASVSCKHLECVLEMTPLFSLSTSICPCIRNV
jgi:hypothetical protein